MADRRRDLDRGWWVDEQLRDVAGEWDVTVQFADGHRIALHLLPSVDLDQVIERAVAAHLAGDRRWTRRSDRGR